MKRTKLNMNEEKKYEVIKGLVDHTDSKGKISTNRKRRASIELGLSLRQINRLIIKIKETGKSGFIHGNSGKVPVNKLDNSISKKIIELYKTKYQEVNINFSHFNDLLYDDEKINVSYTFLRNLLLSNLYISPKAHKKTKKALKEYLKRLANNPDTPKLVKDEIEKRELTIDDVHQRREKSKYFGEVIQMDASSLDWFSDIVTHLHLSIDDSTGIVTAGYFDYQETLNGYYNVLNIILNKYGIPYSFLTDKRTVFEYERLGSKDEEKDTLTQFSYACKRLGIVINTSSVPEVKGSIERLNESFQSRLRAELHLYKIESINEANKYLNEVFIPKYNQKFARTIKGNVFVEMTKSSINEILSIISRRVVDGGNSIKYHNKFYRIFDGSVEKYYSRGTKVLVIKTFDNKLICSIEGCIYNLEELEENKEYSTNFDNKTKQYKVLPRRYDGKLQNPDFEYDKFDNFCKLQYKDKVKTISLSEAEVLDLLYS